jgi:hypothetical protein
VSQASDASKTDWLLFPDGPFLFNPKANSALNGLPFVDLMPLAFKRTAIA